jgi:DNA integrity scanning protein DisA with diadenylate cyclase activity
VANVSTTDDLLRSTLNQVAPGTALRDGLERILRGNTGALIVTSTWSSPPPGYASCPRWTAPAS